MEGAVKEIIGKSKDYQEKSYLTYGQLCEWEETIMKALSNKWDAVLRPITSIIVALAKASLISS